ncbi:LANO_0H03268g1_1 [Lachancea nothofagi CBS 11611]|uniref:Chitin synthase export chaperone n=1 Tax=Lachancea nothofagi CBS 11611 TaxID=1266666 RepID=A0A1G4KLF7_9SACH|nr:LANO_0H03268g1_1 [Lachancea nothofagi CBS 11611]
MAFGDFASICSKTPLPLCSVVKSSKHLVLGTQQTMQDFDPKNITIGILPKCYARSIDVANTVVFQIGNAFVNIGALGVILFMIYSTRQKYTAIGRSEYSFFFELCLGLIVFTLVVDCGVSPPGSRSYPYFVAIQIACASACCWTMSVLGFLGFRFWEDGTHKSMALVRGAAFIGFVISFLVAIFSFKAWDTASSFTSSNTMGLFIVMYVINALAIFCYILCQLVVSIFVISNLWAAGAVLVGVFFLFAGQLLTYAFSDSICIGVKHYLDGLFFGSLCNIFALMMIYKTWDMTTDDDLEFSVSVNKDHDLDNTLSYKF